MGLLERIVKTDKPIIAYCRGPFCLMSDDAVKLLRSQGFEALQLHEDMAEREAEKA